MQLATPPQVAHAKPPGPKVRVWHCSSQACIFCTLTPAYKTLLARVLVPWIAYFVGSLTFLIENTEKCAFCWSNYKEVLLYCECILYICFVDYSSLDILHSDKIYNFLKGFICRYYCRRDILNCHRISFSSLKGFICSENHSFSVTSTNVNASYGWIIHPTMMSLHKHGK